MEIIEEKVVPKKSSIKNEYINLKIKYYNKLNIQNEIKNSLMLTKSDPIDIKIKVKTHDINEEIVCSFENINFMDIYLDDFYKYKKNLLKNNHL